jgi:2-deoxy-D-gluconate 3-dehydrogenase
VSAAEHPDADWDHVLTVDLSSQFVLALREDPARNAAILERIPAGRWARPEDFGGVAVFLAAAASGYVHGALIPVDGGWPGR